jgi:hypothetical protein
MAKINEFQKYGSRNDKKAFDEGWLRIYGVECPMCKGVGYFADAIRTDFVKTKCLLCDGLGKVDPRKVKHDTD